VEPLTDEVGGDCFEPGQRLEAALEDDHLFIAVHALDTEHGLGVQLADGARDSGIGRGHQRPASWT
jgi:hypothetical protein